MMTIKVLDAHGREYASWQEMAKAEPPLPEGLEGQPEDVQKLVAQNSVNLINPAPLSANQRKRLIEELEASLPKIQAEDGLQSSIRRVNAVETIGSPHHFAALNLSILKEYTKPEASEALLEAVQLAEETIRSLLGEYKGLENTFVRKKKNPKPKKHHPDSDTWEYDPRRDGERNPLIQPNVVKKGSLWYEFAKGRINRLTVLGHAVNILLHERAIAQARGQGDFAKAINLGISVGKSCSALEYKPFESVAVGQKKAGEIGTERRNASRDARIYDRFLAMEKDTPAVGARNSDIAVDENMSVEAVESVVRREKNRRNSSTT